MRRKSLQTLTLLTATSAIALGLGAAAMAQTGPDAKRGERFRTQMFERLDADKDGKVTKAEFDKAHAARFKAADKDGDGFVTKEEFAAYGASLRGEFVDRMFARLDKNGDGKLTADELKTPRGNRGDRADSGDRRGRGEGRGLNFDRADAAKKGFITLEDLTKFRTAQFEAALKKRFDRLDTNRDGKLAGDELGERKERILRADANKDGAVTFEEFAARPREMLVRRVQVEFKAIDADGDGKITKAEAEAARGKPMLLLLADADRDGVVTKEELAKAFADRTGARAGNNPVGERFFQALDTDKDGKISAAEWNASGDRRFARLDRNHDGVVTVDEISRRGRDDRGREGRGRK